MVPGPEAAALAKASGGTGSSDYCDEPAPSSQQQTKNPYMQSGQDGNGETPWWEKSRSPEVNPIWKFQPQAEKLYLDIKIQLFVASLIVTNFLTFIISKQIDPTESKYASVWKNLDLFYNTIFLGELLLNMYGSWLCRFWRSTWNVFDFLVVTIGVLDTFQVNLGPLRMLRMMRAFRVFRLFKKIESLNRIIMSLLHAIPGMVNAFLINLIFMCIYAVLAVDFFGDVSRTSRDPSELLHLAPDHDVTVTGRGNDFGKEYYGNFAKSLYTLFQVLTGDSWSEAVVRPILLYYSDPISQLATGMFFVSFIIINAIVLINVVLLPLVASVLLDKMADAEEEKEEGAPVAVVEVEDEVEEDEKLKEPRKGSKEPTIPSVSSDVRQIKEELSVCARNMRTELQGNRKEMEELKQQIASILALIEKPTGI
jgi:hypothetical protein